MSAQQPQLSEPVQAALEELKGLLFARFPEATFDVSAGDDPEGIYLLPTVDVEDTDEVTQVVLDPLMELHAERGLPVYVVPVLPSERVAEQRKPRKLPPVLPQVLHP